MATLAVAALKKSKKRTGLAYWVDRVVDEVDRVRAGFDADAVHDLRVALRRCRSMADAIAEIDPDLSSKDPSWRGLKRASRKLFRRLGELRDAHVMVALVKTLIPEADPLRGRVLETLADQEDRNREKAGAALARFDTKKWSSWRGPLRRRAALVRPDGLVAQTLALARLQKARDLHEHAVHHRSAQAWHELRIGIKRFRYAVENFLPERHDGWIKNLKQLQDDLGDVHDLDELWTFITRLQPPVKPEERLRWSQAIKARRSGKLASYRALIQGKSRSGRNGGKQSLWDLWSGGLPQASRAESAALARFRATSKALDPDFRDTAHLAKFALQLFDALRDADLSPALQLRESRRFFRAATFLSGVGHSAGSKAHHKAARKMIQNLPSPPGWTSEMMDRLALIVRYQRGAEPAETHADFAALQTSERDRIVWLAGTLRLALGLYAGASGEIAVAGIEKTSETAALVIRVRGFVESPKSAARLAAKKHLLESISHRPILIEPEHLALAPAVFPAGD